MWIGVLLAGYIIGGKKGLCTLSSRLDGLTYWRATAGDIPSFSSLEGEVACDVVVVGGGFTGLSAALSLCERGFSVVLLEGESLGFGASGRNGGQVCTGYSADLETFDRVLGRGSSRVYFDLAEEAKAFFVDRLARYNIDCDLVWGHVTGAFRPAHMAGLEALLKQYEALGYPHASILSREGLREHIRTEAYHGGLYDRRAGHLHPMKYLAGLAKAILSLGGKIFEHSKVLGIEEGAGWVMTARGKVKAGAIVVACGAYLEGLIPEVSRKILPVASYVAATSLQKASSIEALLPTSVAVTDSCFVMDYFHRTADDRLLFGGRCSYSGFHPRNLGTSLSRRVARVFPDLKGVTMAYAWGGYVGITWNRLPHVGRMGERMYYAQGYCGQGVLLSGFFGDLLARTVAHEASSFELFSRIPHQDFPGGPLKRVGTSLGMAYYRLKDLLF